MAFDDKLQYYYKTIDEVDIQPLVKDQECIRLHMGPLASSVKENSKQWIGCLGKILHDSAKESLFKLRDELDVSYSHQLIPFLISFFLCQIDNSDIFLFLSSVLDFSVKSVIVYCSIIFI